MTTLTGSAAHLPPGTDPSTVDLLAEESLPRAWRARWSEAPRADVAIDADGRHITAEELEERSRTVANRLAAAGLAPGDRIIISAGASLDLLISYAAAHRLALTVVPMNTTYGAAEIAHIVGNTTPKAALVDDRMRGKAIQSAATQPILVTSCDVPLPAGRDVELDQADRSTPALICHTSGTTGTPKGALLTSGNLLASAEAVRIAWRWTPEDRLVLALPLFHLHGLGVGINGTLVAGATAVILEKFDPVAVGQAIRDRSGSMFFGVPTMYHRFASGPSIDDLRRLRLCVSGSAPLSAELHERIRLASGQPVLERYGMTETVMNLSNPFDGERRPGSVGLPLPGVEVRIEEGEIQLRGPNVFAGYINHPAATADVFTADGWFRSGDLGAEAPDGYIRIVGRSKELIISGGYNVYPREVEEVLATHPGVAEVVVIGRPSEEWGETVTAVVVRNGPVAPADLIAFAGSRLAPYKRPREIHFVDALPRNELGKVQRDQLVIG